MRTKKLVWLAGEALGAAGLVNLAAGLWHWFRMCVGYAVVSECEAAKMVTHEKARVIKYRHKDSG